MHVQYVATVPRSHKQPRSYFGVASPNSTLKRPLGEFETCQSWRRCTSSHGLEYRLARNTITTARLLTRPSRCRVRPVARLTGWDAARLIFFFFFFAARAIKLQCCFSSEIWKMDLFCQRGKLHHQRGARQDGTSSVRDLSVCPLQNFQKMRPCTTTEPILPVKARFSLPSKRIWTDPSSSLSSRSRHRSYM